MPLVLLLHAYACVYQYIEIRANIVLFETNEQLHQHNTGQQRDNQKHPHNILSIDACVDLPCAYATSDTERRSYLISLAVSRSLIYRCVACGLCHTKRTDVRFCDDDDDDRRVDAHCSIIV